MKPLPLIQDQRTFDVLCLGLNACDHICAIPRFPRSGEKLFCPQVVSCGGGQAATAACALARLGYRVAYAGVCGDDAAGRRARPWLEEFGVDAGGLLVKPGTRSQEAFILVEEEEGERTIIWTRDPGCRLDPGDLDLDLITSCKVLHLDGHFVEASIRAARHAREHGALVSLDGEKMVGRTPELVALCDLVVGCQDFAQRLTQKDDPVLALEALAGMGPKWAGRTLGPRGAELLVEGRLLQHPGFPVRARDTTGAGDVFHAGMLHAALQGLGPEEALAASCALGAISVVAFGGRGSLPTAAELRAFMADSG